MFQEDCDNEIDKKLMEFEKFLKISHPNLIKLYEIFPLTDDSMVFIHENLASACFSDCNSRFLEKEAKNLIKQILFALCYLGEKNYFIGNLRLCNLYMQNGNVKIAAYWLFNEIFENKHQISFDDYVYYAPEFFYKNCVSELDASFDCWNVGAIFYELIFNARPNVENLIFPKNTHENSCCISEMGKEFIIKCLEKDPAKRWTVKQALECSYLRK